jgi:hypothetical protein
MEVFRAEGEFSTLAAPVFGLLRAESLVGGSPNNIVAVDPLGFCWEAVVGFLFWELSRN